MATGPELEPDLRFLQLYLFAARYVRAGRAPLLRFSYSFSEELEQTPPTSLPPREGIEPVMVWGIWNGEDDVRHDIVDVLANWDDPWA